MEYLCHKDGLMQFETEPSETVKSHVLQFHSCIKLANYYYWLLLVCYGYELVKSDCNGPRSMIGSLFSYLLWI